MAAAIVGTAVTGQDGASNTTLATAAKSTTTGNTLLVGFAAQEGEGVATISSCTDTAGNTYTALTQIGPGGGGAIARWFYSHNITGNASNVCTGTWSAATRYKHAIQIEISGLKNQAPVSSVGAVPTSSTTASVTIAMGSTVGAVFALATSTNDRTWTAGSGFTEIADWGTSAAAEYYTALNATGNVTTAITASGASNLTFSATGFEEASGAASHPTSGALSSQAATVAGSAAHLTLHATSGALAAQSATISGSAVSPHLSTGALSAQDATITGSAAHLTLHTSTGALSSQAATIAGAAAHEHATSGALAAQDSSIAGSADLSVGGSFSTSGALDAQAATIAGTATHLTLHTSTGALASQAATLAGSAAHEHAASGALASQEATISGAATHTSVGTHDATGALQAQDASLSGVSVVDHIARAATGGSPNRNKQRRRYRVEIDGVKFGVNSPQEAEALLDTMREVAQQRAAEALERANKAEKRPVRKILADVSKALPKPVIKTDAPIDVAAAVSEIESIYKAALQNAELGALLRRQQDEDDADELILMLL